MTASRWTESQVFCDQPGCGISKFSGEFNEGLGVRMNAAGLRAVLRRLGWAVNVHTPDGIKDYCPEHKEGR